MRLLGTGQREQTNSRSNWAKAEFAMQSYVASNYIDVSYFPFAYHLWRFDCKGFSSPSSRMLREASAEALRMLREASAEASCFIFCSLGALSSVNI